LKRRGGENAAVAVITGTRAEFGLLRPVIDELTNLGIPSKLLVTGSHLVDAHGRTASEIEAGGYRIEKEFDILKNDPNTAANIAFPRAFSAFSEYFMDAPPSIALVLGDRYETLAAALAAEMARVPLAHISGGDVTQGAMDDCYRHCITKLSWLHFPSTERYRERVIQLGEAPERVFNVGSLGAENALKLPAIPRDELSSELRFSFSEDYLLVTYHPETLSETSAVEMLEQLLTALGAVGLPVLFTGANADDEGAVINERLVEYCSGKVDCCFINSLGTVRYLSAMRYARALAGNSSSALVEAPMFGVPAVNIGERQRGREMGANVINCEADSASIEAALRKAASAEFRSAVSCSQSPYRGEGTAKKIASEIAVFLNGEESGVKKAFYDLPRRKTNEEC